MIKQYGLQLSKNAQLELQKKYFVWVGDVRKETQKYLISNVWINIYLDEQLKDAPNLATKEKT